MFFREEISVKQFFKGFKDGLPIGLGYLSVSFSFGIMGVSYGLTWWETLLISMTNLTSAGQFAGLQVIATAGTLFEMAVTEFFVNLRYSLMSISLSQKVDSHFKGLSRWFLGFGNTDEIFAVAMGAKEQVSRSYFGGLMVLPWVGWSLGTALGGICGDLLPARVTTALGVALYGMFIAVVVPKLREDHKVIPVVLIAILLSCCFTYIPGLNKIPAGYTITVCCVLSSLVGAIFWPIDMEEEEVAA